MLGKYESLFPQEKLYFPRASSEENTTFFSGGINRHIPITFMQLKFNLTEQHMII